MPKAFQYTGRSKDAVRKRAEQSGGDFDSILKDGFKGLPMKEGHYRLRILPPTWPDAEHFGYDVFVHYGIGADKQSYLCLDKMRGKPCPICRERTRLEASGDSEEASRLAARKRVAVWVINRDAEAEGPKVWSMPWTVDKEINSLCEDGATGELLQIDHPEEGFDVELNKEGSKLRTKYTGVKIGRRSTPISDNGKRQDRWLQYVAENPIPDVLCYYKAEYIEKVFSSAAGKDDMDEEDKPTKRPRFTDEDEPPRKRPTPTEAEEDEEEKPAKQLRDLAEDEEETQPRRAGARR